MLTPCCWDAVIGLALTLGAMWLWRVNYERGSDKNQWP